MERVISIGLKASKYKKYYSFLCYDDSIYKGDTVVVNTLYGTCVGIVNSVSSLAESNMMREDLVPIVQKVNFSQWEKDMARLKADIHSNKLKHKKGVTQWD